MLKNAVATEVRAQYVDSLVKFFAEAGEDVGMITSNAFNFPIVVDGEEAWIKITVTVPKENDGYELREEHDLKVKAAAERKAKQAEKAAKAKAKAKAKEEEA